MDTVESEDKIHIKKILSHKDFVVLRDAIQQINLSDEVKDYITRLVHKTREKNLNILYGSSPR